VIESGKQGNMRIWGCFEREDLVGGCTLTEKLQLGYKAGLNALTTHYGGFILPTSESTKLSDIFSKEHSIISALIGFLEKRYHQIHLFNSPHLKDIRPFKAAGWKVSPNYTYIIKLGDNEKIWKDMEGSVRRIIRKAERESFSIRDGVDIAQMVEIMQDTFGKQGYPTLLGRPLISSICSAGELNEHRYALSAWQGDNNMISAIVGFIYKDRMYYALAGTRRKYLNTGAHSWLIWNLIKRLGGKCNEFDFLGANIPSIARFKEGFNPHLETYFSVEKWTSLMFYCMKKSLRSLRRIRRQFFR
jgi:lipid II:glycine glycyltransferase (peptidoglycan interpeptide bridge formation enzyme)